MIWEINILFERAIQTNKSNHVQEKKCIGGLDRSAVSLMLFGLLGHLSKALQVVDCFDLYMFLKDECISSFDHFVLLRYCH